MSVASSGDVVELGPGIFRGPGNRDLDPGAAGKADLTFRGRLGARATIVDLEGAGRAFNFSPLAGTAIVEDLTIVNGSCTGYSSGERRGGGIAILQANVTLRNLILQKMDCSSGSVVFGGEFSGGAIYLSGASSRLQSLHIEDCSANHGAAIACWGTELSLVEDSTFERNYGKFWGGTLLIEENSQTVFRRCSFSYGSSPYGGHLDDGGTATASFTECTFAYGYATLGGGAYFAFGKTKLVFTTCSFLHNRCDQSAGAVLLGQNNRPTFVGVNFTNNSALAGAAVRSTYAGINGPILFQHTRFTRNRSPNSCTVALQNWGLFEDVVFEENSGSALCTTSVPGYGLVVRNSTFVRNVEPAKMGGAIQATVGSSGSTAAPLILSGVTFDSNAVLGAEANTGGGALGITGMHALTVTNCTFRNNSAQTLGGAIFLAPQAAPSVLPVIVNDTLFIGNSAAGGGGSLYIGGSSQQAMSLTMARTTIANSSTFGDGGGAVLDCATLKILDSFFLGNMAAEGNGGGLVFGTAAKCGPNSLLKDVSFTANQALLGGAAMYFYLANTSTPSCAVPTLPGNAAVWNPQASSSWFWSNFAQSVSKNVAGIGPLQATSPSQLQVVCAAPGSFPGLGACATTAQGVALSGFLGMPLGLAVQLQDVFYQANLDDTLSVEAVLLSAAASGSSVFINGPSKFRIDNGTANLGDALLVASAFPSTVVQLQLLIRLPRAFTSLAHVPGVPVNITLGTVAGQCPAGYVPGAASRGVQCTACPSGSFASLGDTSCTGCSTGRFASSPGSTTCATCPVGAGCPAGTSLPTPCAAGTAQSQAGQELCVPCPLGSYQPVPGQAQCLQCPVGTGTLHEGAQTLEQCLCQQGSFMPANASACQACTAGMVCPTGSTAPGQAADFYVQVSTSAEAYRCAPNQCLAGQAGACAQGREGFVCSRCHPGSYPSNSGTCIPCQSSDAAPVVISLLAVLGFIGFLTFLARTDVSKQSFSVLTALCAAGQILVAVQMLTMINRIQVQWPSVVKAILDVVAIFRFDFGPLRYQCIVGSDSPLLSFVFQLLAFPAAVVALLLITFGFWLCRRPVSWDDLCNSVGLLISLCFLPATVMAVTPFDCVASPNGSSSINKFPAILCGTSLHYSLVAVGVIATMCYTGAVLCVTGLVTFYYPRIIAGGGGPGLLRRFRFLFYRFKPTEYYYGFLFLLRSTLITLIPLVAESGTEVLGFSFVIAAFALLQCTLQPWRTSISNMCDALLSLLVVMLLVAAAALEERAATSSAATATFVLVVLLLVLLSPVVILVPLGVKSLYDRRNGKTYKLFISHHKGDAASLARYLKLCTESRAGAQAFLDSDELHDLDLLLDTVRSRSQHLVVLLTPETLRRPWCAGEIVVAHKCGIPIIPVACTSQELAIEEELACLDSTWRPEQLHQLQVMGLSLDDIRAAYRHFMSLEMLQMPSKFSSSTELGSLHAALAEVLRASGLRGWQPAESAAQRVQAAQTIIVANPVDLDAVAGAVLLQEMMQVQEQVDTCVCFTAEEVNNADNARAIVIFLTTGCLESKDFMAAACEVLSNTRAASMICVRGHANFRHADSASIPALVQRMTAELGDEKEVGLRQAYHRIGSLIAVPFSPSLNKQILWAEVKLLCKRLHAPGSEGPLSQLRNKCDAALAKVPGGPLPGDKQEKNSCVVSI